MTQKHRNITWGASLLLGSFLMFVLIFSLFAPYSLCYMEQLNTAIWSSHIMCPMLWRPGGFSQIVSLGMIQFFNVPWISIVLASIILSLISWLLALYLKRISSNWALAPLGVIPVLSICFLLLNVDFHFSAVISFLLMALCLLAEISVPNGYRRLAVAFTLTICLYLLAGPVTMLYACAVFVQQLIRKECSFTQSLWYLCCILVVIGLAHWCISSGYAADWKHAILPMGYFTLKLQGGNILLMPWIITLIIIILSSFSSYINLSSKFAFLSFLASIGFAVWGIVVLVDKSNEAFKQMNCLARDKEWNKIEEVCDKLPMNNLLFQNYRSMALAEQGKLGDKLFYKPALDIRTIYPIGEKSPYIYMLLSDIYYSMGHISLAQRYAFEANESLGNMSPKLIQRLIDTNIITGQYTVAEKYLNLLDHTAMYKEWAIERRKAISDSLTQAHDELSNKRNCIFPSNRFAGIQGLDDDLAQICCANKNHGVTLQYLGSLYLLSKDLPKFKVTIDSLWDKSQPLPLHFQEALVMLPDSVNAQYVINQDVRERFAQFKVNPRTQPDTYWHFWKYVK